MRSCQKFKEYVLIYARLFPYDTDWIKCSLFWENFYQNKAIGKPPP